MRRPLYFGCWREPGHFLFAQGMQSRSHGDALWERRLISFIDSTLCPPGPQVEGVANVTHLNFDGDPVTALSFWDRSVDKRGGCNSSFLLPGVLAFAGALAAARRIFPEVFARFQFEVVEWKPLAGQKEGPLRDVSNGPHTYAATDRDEPSIPPAEQKLQRIIERWEALHEGHTIDCEEAHHKEGASGTCVAGCKVKP